MSVPPWRADHTCPECGRVRSIIGNQHHHDRADRRTCHACAMRQVVPDPESARREMQRCGTVTAAARYETDEAADWVVVGRLISGMPVPSTPAERAAAIARLTVLGVPAVVIAQRMHVTKRTVERHRARIRSAAA